MSLREWPHRTSEAAMKGRWFADTDGTYWQPCFSDGPGVIIGMDIWFNSVEECETWMRESLGVEPQ